jgi:trehalose-6-phosphate synthase
MSLEERKERWAVMMERLRRDSINEWCRGFLTVLADPRPTAVINYT